MNRFRLMMSLLLEGRSRWFVITNVSSRSWEWHEQRWFPSAFLGRQWDMNGLSRAAHNNRHFYTLAVTGLSTIEWLNSYAVQAQLWPCGNMLGWQHRGPWFKSQLGSLGLRTLWKQMNVVTQSYLDLLRQRYKK